MTNEEHLARAKAQLEAMELPPKCLTFLLGGLTVCLAKPIHSIDIQPTWGRGAKYSVFYEDGDERQFEASPPKPKQE